MINKKDKLNIVKKSKKKISYSIFIFVLLIIISISINAQVPQTINIAGKILKQDLSGAENGQIVYIYNFNEFITEITQVYAPPVPSLKGSYSATITGSIGDIIRARAYNYTHYGELNKTITDTTTIMGVTMNQTRTPEANINITYPLNNSLQNTSSSFNLTANITMLGNSGTNCQATIMIQDTNILNLKSGELQTNNLGAFTLGQTKNTTFQLEVLTVGLTTISVNSTCSESLTNFENLNNYTIFISTQDFSEPIITIISPDNQTENSSTNTINIKYNVTDDSLITQCRLYINETLNKTENSITKDIEQIITTTLPNGIYNYTISCTDQYSNIGQSETRTINISVHSPEIIIMSPDTNIMLNAGSTTIIECNATAQDLNGNTQIQGMNMTLYSETTNHLAADNERNKYTNNSCLEISAFGNQKNYSCTFELEYYAINGTWTCNATTIDQYGYTGANNSNLTIYPLYAINTSKTLIDYGDVQAGKETSEENITLYNIGNQQISINAKGYGGTNPITGNNMAMMCDLGQNISIEKHKYATIQGQSYSSKTSLSSINQATGITINNQIAPGLLPEQDMYWQIKTDTGSGVQCNGTIVLTATIQNTGNVRIEPTINLKIFDQEKKEIVKEIKYAYTSEILPTLRERIEAQLDNELPIGQYWVEMSAEECSGTATKTFSVLDKGGISDKGEFLRIENKPWAETQETIPIIAYFKNYGDRQVSAQFKGIIESNNKILQTVESEKLIASPGQTIELQTFFKPQIQGQYQVKGKIIYNDKLTFEKGSIINVIQTTVGTKENEDFLWSIILSVIIIIIGIMFFMILNKKKKHKKFKY
ncbi:hypothetical protein K9M18_00210 [Candidatus Woesearchaeota archaeon]|nr:hypothetical protein [Candidatus Woesearchaeota archaeon]MCF8012949.1 hypothetical protein [Candidatus Woesearchaeota archaeon]